MTEKLKAATASRNALDQEINKRKKLEGALQRTRFSIDHSNDMLYWVDPEGNIVDINDTTCGKLGYSREELLSMRVDDIDPYMPLDEYRQIWRKLKNRRLFKFETVHYAKNGEPIPVEITLNYIAFGGKEYNCAFARDITERKQSQAELQKSMAELDVRVRQLNCLFEISRLDGRRRLSLAEILQGIIEIIPLAWQYPEFACARIILEDQEFKTENFRETDWKLKRNIIVQEKIKGTLEVRYLEQKPQIDEGSILREEKDLVASIAERLGKIIERKQAQLALQESEKRFRDLVENSLTGISIIQDGQIVYQNPEEERLLGPLPRPVKFEDIKTIHPDDVEKVRKFYQNVSAGKMPGGDTDFRFYSPGETPIPANLKWFHSRASLIEYQGKDAILVNMMDMTKAKELEHLLTIQDKMASLGRVAAGIAHEIRNPLSGINIYLNTLQKLYHKDGSEERVGQIFQQLNSASHKIESVIRRVMDFAKPSEPRLSLIDINQPITDAFNLTAVSMRKSGIKLEMSLADNLPPAYADKNLIEQMILNLLTNAAEAMKSMEKDKKIAIVSSTQKNRIIIKVSDSGPGIPLNFRDKIFDPYFTTKSEGTGIGLSLSHRIITDHGGSLFVSDSELGGAVFRVEIPVKKRNA